MPEETSRTYVARCRCGCGAVVIAVVDGGDQFTANEVAKGMRKGYSFDRVTTAEVRGMPFGCRVEKAAREAKAAGKVTLRPGAQLSLIGADDV